MSIAFLGRELINIAIGIERSGITFYDIMAKSTDDAMARNAFQHLADMEREHIQIFQDMLDDAGRYQLAETTAEEHADYLQALIDSAVFTDDMITSAMATQADSDIKAVELGISAEKDSILFYYQMREVMPQPAHSIINRIIAEEKAHLQQLSEIKKRLIASG
jgi:rubrerythrin